MSTNRLGYGKEARRWTNSPTSRRATPNAAKLAKVPFLVSPSLRDVAGQLLSDALRVREWASYYHCSSKTMLKILRQMVQEGHARQYDRLWQIRLVEAPPQYLIDAKLLQSVVGPKLAIELVDALELSRFGKN